MQAMHMVGIFIIIMVVVIRDAAVVVQMLGQV